MSISSENLLQCQHCPFNTIVTQAFLRHVRCHENKSCYTCYLCSYSNTQLRWIARHEMLHSSTENDNKDKPSDVNTPNLTPPETLEKYYQCPNCPFWAVSVGYFRNHMIRYTNKRPFKCSACNFESKSEISIQQHIVRQKDEDHEQAKINVHPEFEEKQFDPYLVDNNKNVSNAHVLSKENQQNEQAASSLDLEKSKEKLAENAEKREEEGLQEVFCCPHCSYMSPEPAKFKSHYLWKHVEELPHKCTKCDFHSNVQNLRKHINESLDHERARCVLDERAAQKSNIQEFLLKVPQSALEQQIDVDTFNNDDDFEDPQQKAKKSKDSLKSGGASVNRKRRCSGSVSAEPAKTRRDTLPTESLPLEPKKKRGRPKRTRDPPSAYFCPHCVFFDADKDVFHRHFLTHKKLTFGCSACGFESRVKFAVNRHIEKEAASDPKHREAKAVDHSERRDYNKFLKSVPASQVPAKQSPPVNQRSRTASVSSVRRKSWSKASSPVLNADINETAKDNPEDRSEEGASAGTRKDSSCSRNSVPVRNEEDSSDSITCVATVIDQPAEKTTNENRAGNLRQFRLGHIKKELTNQNEPPSEPCQSLSSTETVPANQETPSSRDHEILTNDVQSDSDSNQSHHDSLSESEPDLSAPASPNPVMENDQSDFSPANFRPIRIEPAVDFRLLEPELTANETEKYHRLSFQQKELEVELEDYSPLILEIRNKMKTLLESKLQLKQKFHKIQGSIKTEESKLDSFRLEKSKIQKYLEESEASLTEHSSRLRQIRGELISRELRLRTEQTKVLQKRLELEDTENPESKNVLEAEISSMEKTSSSWEAELEKMKEDRDSLVNEAGVLEQRIKVIKEKLEKCQKDKLLTTEASLQDLVNERSTVEKSIAEVELWVGENDKNFYEAALKFVDLKKKILQIMADKEKEKIRSVQLQISRILGKEVEPLQEMVQTVQTSGSVRAVTVIKKEAIQTIDVDQDENTISSSTLPEEQSSCDSNIEAGGKVQDASKSRNNNNKVCENSDYVSEDALITVK